MPTSVFDSILTLFKPDFVFSLVFLLAFLGFGHFVNSSLFPWFKEYMAARFIAQESESKRFDQMIEVITEFKGELSAFRETHAIILAYIINNLTENENQKASDTASVLALRKKQDLSLIKKE